VKGETLNFVESFRLLTTKYLHLCSKFLVAHFEAVFEITDFVYFCRSCCLQDCLLFEVWIVIIYCSI